MNIQLNILQNWLVEQSVDAAFINDPSTLAYLSGYESGNLFFSHQNLKKKML